MHAIEAMRRWRAAVPPALADVALAIAVAAFEVAFVLGVDVGLVAEGLGRDPAPRGVAVAVALAGSLPIAVRTRAPLVVLAVVVAVSLAGVPLGVWSPNTGALIAFYTAAAYIPRRRSAIACVTTAAAMAAVLTASGDAGLIAWNLVLLVAIWAFGDRQQTRRSANEALEQRAERAEADRDRRARLAVSEERARIARELHDVLAHSVSVMVVQAAAARRTLRTDLAVAEEALAAVEETGRQSLGDLRGLLGLLRDEGADPELAPLPGLARLSELVDGFADAGLPVRVEVSGAARRLASRVDLSAYRIVQEALTNALKHARPKEVVVRVRYSDAAVEVEVVDDGPGQPAAVEGAGHGLAGMRERAALVGGTLRVGPRAGGGFRVAASLPAP